MSLGAAASYSKIICDAERTRVAPADAVADTRDQVDPSDCSWSLIRIMRPDSEIAVGPPFRRGFEK